MTHRTLRFMTSTAVAVWLATSSLILFETNAAAAVPGEVNYQGLLLDDLGDPITGDVDLDFALFTTLTGGSSVWSEAHSATPVLDGVYEVALGSVAPITPALLSGGTLYLEVTVEGETLTPRQPLLAVPYAIRADTAEDAVNAQTAQNALQVGGLSADFTTELWEHYDFDGGAPANTDSREGLADIDNDGRANFIDSDNDNDGISDVEELANGSDINVVTPVIDDISPATGDGWTTTQVSIQGDNFLAGVSVSFGSQNPVPSNLTSTSFDVTVGPQPPGTVPVVVTLPNAESSATTFGFFYFTPVITGLTPSPADGWSTTELTVQGENFIAGLSVSVDGQNLAPSNLTSTSFTIDVGPHVPATVPVVVTLPNANFAATSFDFFYFDPVITGYSEIQLQAASATVLTVFGENFISGLTVQVGLDSPTPSNVTPTSFDVTVGPAAPGAKDVTVTLPNGRSITDLDALFFGEFKAIFATSTQHTGDFGGLAAGDAICAAAASGASLPGTFLAWLGDSTDSPSSRDAKSGVPYRLVDGTIVANDWTDLVDGTLAHEIDLDESGAPASGAVWTGVAADGTTAGNHCIDWSGTASVGMTGRTDRVDTGWTAVGNVSCTFLRRLYCIEQ